jgi:hypothetical protein
MSILSLALILSCLPSVLLDLALPKWAADKNVRIEDAYKWLYQATRGGEHAVPDAGSARNWLAGEWASLGKPLRNEPAWAPLCPGGEIGRLNLRPFRASGGSPDALIEAFLASSREFRTDPQKFIDAWTELGKRLKKRSAGKLTRKTWAKLDVEMKEKGYPSIHHSEVYEKAERPAYRILTFAEMRKLTAKRKRP